MIRKQEFFVCLSLSRQDLVFLGYKNANRLSDKTMEAIAADVADDAVVMESWWTALESTCDRMALQKRAEEP